MSTQSTGCCVHYVEPRRLVQPHSVNIGWASVYCTTAKPVKPLMESRRLCNPSDRMDLRLLYDDTASQILDHAFGHVFARDLSKRVCRLHVAGCGGEDADQRPRRRAHHSVLWHGDTYDCLERGSVGESSSGLCLDNHSKQKTLRLKLGQHSKHQTLLFESVVCAAIGLSLMRRV